MIKFSCITLYNIFSWKYLPFRFISKFWRKKSFSQMRTFVTLPWKFQYFLYEKRIQIRIALYHSQVTYCWKELIFGLKFWIFRRFCKKGYQVNHINLMKAAIRFTKPSAALKSRKPFLVFGLFPKSCREPLQIKTCLVNCCWILYKKTRVT